MAAEARLNMLLPGRSLQKAPSPTGSYKEKQNKKVNSVEEGEHTHLRASTLIFKHTKAEERRELLHLQM